MMSFVLVLLQTFAWAAIKGENVDYGSVKNKFEGYVAYDDSSTAKRPVVLIVHDWMGISDDTKMRAHQLAEMGYLAFAADIYGKGVRPKDANQAGELAGKYKNDRKELRARAKAGYDFISKHKLAATGSTVAIGYCFGGTTVLEMGRAGLPLTGIVSFHGGLDSPAPADAKNIKGKVLVLHGAIDPYVPTKDVEAFEKELNDAKVDYQLVKYSGAVHAFTFKGAGNDPSKGAAYNEVADKRSWIAFKDFLGEVSPASKTAH